MADSILRAALSKQLEPQKLRMLQRWFSLSLLLVSSINYDGH